MSEERTNAPVATATSKVVAKENSPDILVVDDDQMILDLLGKVLKKFGFEVALSNNGKDALSLIRGTTPDVILVDIKMPGMDGITVLKQIKAFDPDIEVVIMTGFAGLDSAVEALRYGAFDYIQKPFNQLDHVVNAIRHAWERRKPRKEGRNKEASLERRIYELKVLYNLSRTLGDCSEGNEMMAQLSDSLGKLFAYDLAISLWRERSKQTKLLLQAVTPCSFNFVEEAKSNLIETFNSLSESKISGDMTFDRILGEENIRQEKRDDLRIAEKVKSFLNVPLVNQKQMVGMINFSSRLEKSFSPSNIYLIYNAVSQVGPSLDKANGIEVAEESNVQKLLEGMPEGLVMIDEDFKVVEVNKMAQEILGQREPTFESIQKALGLDLTKFNRHEKKAGTDLMKKEAKIGPEHYEVIASILRGTGGTFKGFMLSLRQFAEEKEDG